MCAIMNTGITVCAVQSTGIEICSVQNTETGMCVVIKMSELEHVQHRALE